MGPWSGIGAVSRAPLGVVRTLAETRRLLEQAMREALAVARACGAKPSDGVVERSLSLLDHGPAWNVGNMRDILDGRPSELETEIGVIVRLARKTGVAVPRHEFLYASLLPQERKARGQIDYSITPEARKAA